MKEYQYDVFLSFTGADRELKNTVKERLGEMGLSFYDSDLYCMGQFRSDYCEALDKSRVYLLLLTDNLRNDPMFSKRGKLTEVRRECELALELESANELNVVILCMSEFFRFSDTYHDYYDQVGWFFYSRTRGFSQIYGSVTESGDLSEKTLGEVTAQCKAFIDKRNAGQPVLSQMTKIEIAEERLLNNINVKGRREETEQVLSAFASGKQAVILRGMGGMGKTTLATSIASECNEMGYLKCPQIIHVQELLEQDGGIRAVLSSVSYEKHVYDSLSVLSERDKYERKWSALCSLPETTLLVIDNFNSLRKSDLDMLLGRLKCRLLITTRKTLECDDARVETVQIEKLPLEAAREMFLENYGGEVESDVFEKLYDFVGGHTITLCIVAKMMRLHKLSVEEMIAKMGELDDEDARVDFAHNEFGDNATVVGHLQNLFEISALPERALKILRSMSILSDGTVATDDLMRVLNLKNRNEIIALIGGGWLESREIESDGVKREYLYLHPILLRLMAKLLVPTEQNVSEMINHLIETADTASDNLTYSDVSDFDDKLFYACFVLAGGNRHLSRELWNRFVSIDRLMGDSDKTREKVETMLSRIDSEEERLTVRAYSDMILLEQHPTDLELLEKYIDTLGQNANNYKWVMRSLSVTLQHLSENEKYRDRLAVILEKAIDSAMFTRDDLSLLNLFTYYFFVSKNIKKSQSKLKKYIKQRKKEESATGATLYLELLVSYFVMMPAGCAADIYKSLDEMLDAVLEEKGGKAIKMFLRHPIVCLSNGSLLQKMTELDDSDPLASPLKTLVNESNRLLDEKQLDAMNIIQAAVDMHYLQLANHSTLNGAEKAVAGVLGVLRRFPENVIRRGALTLSEGIDHEKLTVRSLSQLQIAALINREYNESLAVSQTKQILEAVRRMRPAGHPDVVSALVSYADAALDFNNGREALDAYVEVYKLLKRNNGESAMLGRVSNCIIRMSEFKVYNNRSIYQILCDALASCEKYSREYFLNIWHYILRIADRCPAWKLPEENKEYFDKGVALIDEALAADVKGFSIMAQDTLIDTIAETAAVMTNKKAFTYAEELYARLDAFKRCKKSVRNKAKIRKLSGIGYVAFHREDSDGREKYEIAIRECIKCRAELTWAALDFWMLLTLLPKESRIESLRFGEKLGAALFEQIRVFKENCITLTFEEGVEFSEKQKEEGRTAVYEKLLLDMASEHKHDMGLTVAEYKQFRTVEQFYAAVVSRLTSFLTKKYEQAPLSVTIGAPKNGENKE